MNENKKGQGTLIWLVCWVADMLRTFRVNFSDIFRYLPSQWQGCGEDIHIAWWWCQSGLMMILLDDDYDDDQYIALSFWFHTFWLQTRCIGSPPFSDDLFSLKRKLPIFLLWKNISCFLPKLWTAGSQLKKENLAFYICELCPLHFVCVGARLYLKKNASSHCLYEGVFGIWCDVWGLMSEAWGFRCEVT